MTLQRNARKYFWLSCWFVACIWVAVCCILFSRCSQPYWLACMLDAKLELHAHACRYSIVVCQLVTPKNPGRLPVLVDCLLTVDLAGALRLCRVPLPIRG